MITNAEIEGNVHIVAERFCVPFEQLPKRPYDEDEMKVWLMFAIMEEATEFASMKEELEQDFLYKVMAKRLEVVFNYKMDFASRVLVLMLCLNPADVVMYLTYLQYWCFANRVTEINVKVLGSTFLGEGAHYDEDVSKLWYELKCEITGYLQTDNLLDRLELLKPFML